MKVAVIGTGRVGLPLALSLVDAGVDVKGVDLNERVRHSVNVDRVMPFSEPGYDDLVRSGKLTITGDIREVRDYDYFIVTVGTPVLQHIETDLSFVTAVVSSLCEFLGPGQTVILRSTCAPRTTAYVAGLIETRTKLKVGQDVMVACCPERIVEGKAREELPRLPQVIGAQDARSAQSAERLFRALGVETLHCNYTTAELVKLFCFEVFGTETGRRRENHQVHTAVDQLLIVIEADKAFGWIDFDLLADFPVVLQRLEAALHGILESIGHGHQFHVAVRAQRLFAGAQAAASAADQPDLDGVAWG
jgi:hypothetical protein